MNFSICVFCGSRPGVEPAFTAAAESFGRELGARGIRLVYGGGGTGLMGTVARATLAAGGRVTGIMPSFMVEKEAAWREQPDLRIVRTMHERKALLTSEADAFVALPGGLGTLEELFEVWSHAQIGLHAKPIGVLNTGGYFDDLLRFVDRSVKSGFTKPNRLSLLQVAVTPAALIARLTSGTG